MNDHSRAAKRRVEKKNPWLEKPPVKGRFGPAPRKGVKNDNAEKMYEQQDRVAAFMGLSGLLLRHFAQQRRGKK